MSDDSVRERSKKRDYNQNPNISSPIKDKSVGCDVNIETDSPDNYYLPYDHPIKETHIQSYTKMAMEEMFSKSIVLEEEPFSGDGKTHIIDVIIPDENVAIECKGGNRNSIQRGISQCMFYRYNGYNEYLFVSDYWDGLVNLCEEYNIPLVHCKPHNNGFNILTDGECGIFSNI